MNQEEFELKIFQELFTHGNYVTFGRFEQDNNLYNGKEPLEWIVLDMQEDKTLLISRYALNTRPINTTVRSHVLWENCSLRMYLNGDFLRTAFSNDEQSIIIDSEVDNGIEQNKYVNGGNNTFDRVFLLSYAEVNEYFKTKEERKCLATQYAMPNREYKNPNGYATWWLRSPGNADKTFACVFQEGVVSSAVVHSLSIFVRPAIWVDTKSLWRIAKGESLVVEEHLQTKESEVVDVGITALASIAPTPIQYIQIHSTGAANLRERPSSDSKRIGSLQAGSQYELLSVMNNGWYKIRLANGTEGYVHPNMASIVK